MTIAAFPAKLQCLFLPKRYKVLWGGRDAGRSWGCARALLLMGAGKIPDCYIQPPIRILCAREYQNSISDSVHQLLADQIGKLGLESLYEVQRDRIIGPHGTRFAFEGIAKNTLRIKSYEGYDICWVEEAVNVTKSSWQILIPTIRKEGSEIWITFNPELDTDYTYKRFVLEADPTQSTVVKLSYRDNPWLTDTIKEEIRQDYRRDKDYYLNVWEGHTKQSLEGAVYAKELRRCQEDGRITNVDWDPEYPVETAWDLGRADGTSIWFFQRIAMQHRVIGYYDAVGTDISDGLNTLQSLPYNYGMHHLPPDAKAKTYGTRHSIEEIMRKHYPEKVNIVRKLSLTDGINATRMLLRRCWISERNCGDGLMWMRRYVFKVINGQFSREPNHEPPQAEAAASAFRYMAIASGNMRAIEPMNGEQIMAERMAAQDARSGRMTGAIASALSWMR